MSEALVGGGKPEIGSVAGPGVAEPELMQRAALLDDGAAFDALTERWTPLLMRYFYPRKTRIQQDAADMTQEVLFRAWRYRASWIDWCEAGGTFSPWIYKIALRVFLSWVKKNQGDPVSVAANDPANLGKEDAIDPLKSVAQPGPSVAEWAECAESWQAIRACVESLEPEVQDILWMWIWEEATHEEIRDRLWPARSLGAARRYVNRRGGAALDHLRRCLQRKGIAIPCHQSGRWDPLQRGGNR
jgi:DNA-directed RNA polymerase specialized sigma24 family protein